MKMKTTNKNTRISRISMVLCSAIAFGSVLYAQPHAGSDANNPDEAYNRLETLMANTEEAAKYVAPSIDAPEVIEAMERLELLANNTEMAIRYEAPTIETAELNDAVERLEVLASNIENEIRYRVQDEDQTNSVEYASEQNNQENEALNALTLIIAYVKSK
jgi:hypothetical protein